VDQGSAGAAISVDERVDGLELGVRNGCPHDGVAVGGGDESSEVVDKSTDLLMWRWHEVGAQRAPAGSSDPVLLTSNARRERGFDHMLQLLDIGCENFSIAIG
jgi:hypothetical protein